MVIKTVDINKTQMFIKELLALVMTGSEIIFTESSIPVARLVPIAASPTPTPQVAGLHPGAILMSEDFDEPLSDSFWVGR